jgi:hypothetical protein
MRTLTGLLVSCFVFPLIFTACGDDPPDADPFDTLQACFDEHHTEEMLSVHDAIVVCCLDHPIAGVHPSCGNSQAECMTHVDAELDSSVTGTEITDACTTYIDMK